MMTEIGSSGNVEGRMKTSEELVAAAAVTIWKLLKRWKSQRIPTVFIVSPSIFHEVMGLDAMILVF